jgi:micrococcal nuclease
MMHRIVRALRHRLHHLWRHQLRLSMRLSMRLMALALTLAAPVCACAAETWPPLAQARPSTLQGSLPSTLTGRAVDISDGDTFVLLEASGRRWRIRLAGIDAPESGQPGAEASRAQLQAWLQQGRVLVESVKIDPFGRLVAHVYVLGTAVVERDPDDEIGLRMVRAGHAWHFKRYRADQTLEAFVRFDEAEQAARAAGRGLWSEPDPEAPWRYRERRRSSAR